MSGIWFAAGTALCFGLGERLLKREYGRSGLHHLLRAFGLAQLFLQVPLALIQEGPVAWSWTAAGLTLAVTAGNVTYLMAAQRLPISVASPLVAVYLVLPPGLGVLFLQERLLALQWIGLALTFAGVVVLLLTAGHGAAAEPRGLAAGALAIAVLSAVTLGLATFALKATELAPRTFLLTQGLLEGPICILLAARFRPALPGPWVTRGALWVHAWFAVGQVCQVVAITRAPLTVAMPVIAVYPAVTILLATALGSERLRRPQFVATAGIVAGLGLTMTGL